MSGKQIVFGLAFTMLGIYGAFAVFDGVSWFFSDETGSIAVEAVATEEQLRPKRIPRTRCDLKKQNRNLI